jgi:hypothetical protein
MLFLAISMCYFAFLPFPSMAHSSSSRVCSAADYSLVILMGDGPRLSLCGPVLDKQQHSTIEAESDQ